MKKDGHIEKTPIPFFAITGDGEVVAMLFDKNVAVPVPAESFVVGPGQPQPSILRIMKMVQKNEYSWAEFEKNLAFGKINPPPGVTLEEFVQVVAELQNEHFTTSETEQ